MSKILFRRRVKSALFFLMLAASVIGIWQGIEHLSCLHENIQFERLTDRIFCQEVSSSALDLHYTLANPQKYGINNPEKTLGNPCAEPDEELLNTYKNVVSGFSGSRLSDQNRRLQKVIRYQLDAREKLGESILCQEFLSPSLGIQAQLPVLMAEYTFRTKQDILDYLVLLKSIPDYFQSIISLEQKKAEKGLFMNQKAAEGVIEQCEDFISDPEHNYLDTVFPEKLSKITSLTHEESASLLTLHKKIIKTCVIPAYQSLINALNSLKSTGKNPYGLCYLSGGSNYYEYLLKTSVGTSDSPEQIRRRLQEQLIQDIRELQSLVSDSSLQNGIPEDPSISQQPTKILASLQKKMSHDFPALNDISYDIKYVHEDLSPYLSPAFYLTPPVDTNSPNSIYINPDSNLQGTELFTTLAHEGFPGHLYQTIYFAQTDPPLLRHLFSPAGYIEGWATYIESYAYQYADIPTDQARILWLNRSIHLCLYSLMDLGIHYYGWTPDEALQFLSPFGITDTSLVQNIYQYIVETPTNYLKYYWGYLNFLDLKTEQQKKNPDFHLKNFHQQILEIGPMPFSLLKEELNAA